MPTLKMFSYLFSGHVPSLREGNLQENIFSFPWLRDKPVVLGKPYTAEFFYFVKEYIVMEFFHPFLI